MKVCPGGEGGSFLKHNKKPTTVFRACPYINSKFQNNHLLYYTKKVLLPIMTATKKIRAKHMLTKKVIRHPKERIKITMSNEILDAYRRKMGHKKVTIIL